MERQPTISVIMPVRDAEACIGETIKTILEQSFADFECIVINDGSIDETDTAVREFKDDRIRDILCTESKGRAFRLNQALTLARGEFCALIRPGERLGNERFQKQVNALRHDPFASVCLSRPPMVPRDEEEKEPRDMFLRLLTSPSPGICAVPLIRTTVLLDADGFDKEEEEHAGYELILRLVLRGSLIADVRDDLPGSVSPENGSPGGNRHEDRDFDNHIRLLVKNVKGVSAADMRMFVDYFSRPDECVASLGPENMDRFVHVLRVMHAAVLDSYPESLMQVRALIDKAVVCKENIMAKMRSYLRIKNRLTDPEFARRISPELRERAVMVSEIWEHLSEHDIACEMRNQPEEEYTMV